MKLQKKTFKLVPEGQYDAVVLGIVGTGVHSKPPLNGVPRVPVNQLKIIFEIPSLLREDKTTEMVSVNSLTLSSSEMSRLYPIINAILGKTLTEDQMAIFIENNIQDLLGRAVTLNVSHKLSRSKRTYVEVNSIQKLDARLPQPKGTRETFVFDFDNPSVDVFKNHLSVWTQKEILSALNKDKLPKAILDLAPKDNLTEQNLLDGINNVAEDTPF